MSASEPKRNELRGSAAFSPVLFDISSSHQLSNTMLAFGKPDGAQMRALGYRVDTVVPFAHPAAGSPGRSGYAASWPTALKQLPAHLNTREILHSSQCQME